MESTTPLKKIQQLVISWSSSPAFTKFLAGCVIHSVVNAFHQGTKVSLELSQQAHMGLYGVLLLPRGSKSGGCRHRGGAREAGGLSADPGGMCHGDQAVLGGEHWLVSLLGNMRIPWVLGLNTSKKLKGKKRCILLKNVGCVL